MELFRLLGTIAIENKEANAALNETSMQGELTQTKLGKTFSKIGSAAAKVGKAVAAGVAVGGTAIVGIAKQAVESYANYEQLVGGVETLFKDSADTVMQYAQNAYKTAGLSANEYMETVTSFSASLLQSLGGDTAKAAKVADRAITDMSDNANKMGTSMEMIQNAYNGFAKQNFTMLDNLKLGYGGTKEEMERLLEDAEKLSGIEYDISSYADIVEAIHVVQTEMGITGTTAKEASSTIQGSAISMKSAWKNLLTGMADENQNLELLFTQFLDSVVVFGDNLIPRIQQLLPRVVETISKLVSSLAENLPAIIESLVPVVIKGAFDIMKALIKKFPDLARSIITALANSLIPAFTEIFEEVKAIVKKAIEKLKNMMKFEWSLPKLKMPHFSITGKFSLDPPSVPKLSVEWYKKGAVLTRPTVFGLNPVTGSAMVGGEAGAEAVAPISVLQDYVKAAVSEANQDDNSAGIYTVLSKILYLLQNNRIMAVMDGEKMGEFVIQTVEREVYA